jgi:CBS domain-containing protein
VPYSLFFFGSGGRHELTLSFKVQMGVVFQDLIGPGHKQEAETYFGLLAEILNKSLLSCDLTGREHCLKKENIQGASVWQEQYKIWGTRAGSGRDAGFFDMRAIRGDHEKVNSLRSYLISRTNQSRGLMEALAADTLQVKPPLGFFKDFVVEKGGEHKNKLNLYERGIKPLVGCARIFGLEKGVIRRSTMGRLHELNARHGFKVAEDMAQAFGYLHALLVHNQLRQAEEGGIPDNFINPDVLTNLERKTLKESFQLTARLYEEIEGNYWSGKILP